MKQDKWIHRWTIKSSSSDGDYIVSQDAEGKWACSCKGWTTKAEKYCPVCNLHLEKKSIGTNPKNGKTIYEFYCHRCHKTPENPRTERVDCKHIIEVQNGGGKTLDDAVLDRLAGL